MKAKVLLCLMLTALAMFEIRNSIGAPMGPRKFVVCFIKLPNFHDKHLSGIKVYVYINVSGSGCCPDGKETTTLSSTSLETTQLSTIPATLASS